MALIKIQEGHKRYLIVATIAALILGLWLLKNYLILIAFSAVMVILFNPIYHKLLQIKMKPGGAAFATLLSALLIVIIPLSLIIVLMAFQLQAFATVIADGGYNATIVQYANQTIDAINRLLESVNVAFRISLDSLTANASGAAEQISSTLFNTLRSTIGGVFSFITTSIIFIYVFISMLLNQAKIMDTVKKLNPLGDEVSELYLRRIEAMTKATVRGQFIIAFWQGTVSAAVLAVTGLGDLFFFFWAVLTVFSIIPLGAGIISIPIGLTMMITGNIWQGIIVILNHVFVVSNIDNVLRPKLVPQSARLDAALMILAVFAGMGMFGFFGIVLGPVIMIIVLTTIQLFLEVFRNTKSIGDEKTDTPPPKPKHKFWQASQKKTAQ